MIGARARHWPHYGTDLVQARLDECEPCMEWRAYASHRAGKPSGLTTAFAALSIDKWNALVEQAIEWRESNASISAKPQTGTYATAKEHERAFIKRHKEGLR